MRSRVQKFAHVLERLGLAMAGAASGLFVAIHVGSSIDALTTEAFLLAMMIGGAVGFYLGIDTPPQLSHAPGKINAPELLSAVGIIMAGWSCGVVMQIVAGAIARWRG